MTPVLNRITDAIESCIPRSSNSVALHEPSFAGNEKQYVNECLESGWISYLSKYVQKFEGQLAEFVGVREAIAMVNGTTALHLSLKIVGVNANEEVIVPALTFVATANAVSYCGAVPHFADSTPETLGIDPEKLRQHLLEIGESRSGSLFNKTTGRRIAAVMAMHTYGHPVDLDALVDVCAQFKLPLVEDAAESLGSYYKGRHTGQFGRCSVLSFNGNKVVTTGGGGALLTNDPELGKLARHLSTTAKLAHSWSFDHDAVGFNYRMPGLNAAVGCGQMEQLARQLVKKRALAQAYIRAFKDISQAVIFQEPSFATSNYWLNVLLLESEFAYLKTQILETMHAKKILCRPAWTLMHHLPMYKDCPRMELAVAEDLERRLINLPSSPGLAERLGVTDINLSDTAAGPENELLKSARI